MLKNRSFNLVKIGCLATIFIALSHLLSSISYAQAQTSDLSVTVTDAEQAIVAGASVTITKEGSTQSLTLITDQDGRAVFNGIEPGNYQISVQAANFKSFTQNVRVSIGLTQSVTIALSAPVTVDVSAVEQTQSDQLSALPNFNNDLTPILQATVGAIPAGSGQLGRVIIDGKGKDTTTIRLDGIDATPQIDLPSADPALDIIDSFQKPGVAFDADNPGNVSRAFAPQFGPGTGTVFNNKTLSAIATWRGQFSAEHLNDAFNARNYFDYFGKNAIQRTRFGAKAGGGLGEKNFLYFAYEGVRGRTERSFFEAVPLEAICRCGVGAPLGSLLGNYLPSGTVILPNPALTPGYAIGYRRGRTLLSASSGNIRFDRTLSAKMNLTLRYTPQFAEAFVPDGITGRSQRQKIFFNNFVASYDFVLGSSFSSTVRFGFNGTRVKVDSENPVALSPELTRASVGINGNVNVAGLPGINSVPVASIGALIKGVGRGFDLEPQAFTVSYDGTSIINNRHQLFFGVETRVNRYAFDRLGGISYSFSNLTAFRTAAPTSTNYLADLSGPSPFSGQTGKRRARQNYFLSYLQFKSQPTENLTMTYGLRYDYFGGVTERDNRAFLIDPESGGVLPSDSSLIRAKKNNFQPRFGLAYKFTRDGFFENAVLNLGVGIYAGSPRIADLLLPVESDRLNTTINGGNFTTGIDDILRDFRAQPLTRQFQPLAFSRDFEIPEKLYKWEASIKKPIKGMYDLVFLYTGNTGRQLPVARVANPIVSVATNPDPAQPARVVRQFDIISNDQILKPFGEFFYRTSEGRSNYNAFSVQFKTNNGTPSGLPDWLRLRFLSIQYIYALNKGNASGAVISNPLEVDADYGYNSADVRHSLSFSAVYNLWEAVGGKRKQSSLLWGWRIAPLLSLRSGLPLIVKLDRPDVVYRDAAGNIFSTPAAGRTAILNLPTGGASGGTQVPDLLPNVDPYKTAGGLSWLNPQAFAVPLPGTFGNLRRGQLRGPGSVSLDLGISRFLFDNDRFGAELRMDVFNVFNRANFSNPTASLPNALGTGTEAGQIQPGIPFSALSAPSFGKITAADPGRRVQFSIVLRFKGGFTK